MPVTTCRARWLGAGTETHKPDRGSSRQQRQRCYQAVELPGGGQVCVNDVVETENEQRRLAQVICMWEDPFSGSCKFRARWLVRAADLPEKVLSRLRLRSAGRRSLGRANSTASDAGRADSRSSTSAAFENSKKGGKRHDADESDGDGDSEVFLTSETDDLDLSLMARLVVLSLEAVGASPDIRGEASQRGQTGPRLSHSFDHVSREFAPLAITHPIFARARARRVEATGLDARVVTDTTSDRSSRAAVTQTRGWMPLKRSWRTATGDGIHAVTSAPLPAPAPMSSIPSPTTKLLTERPATRDIERGYATAFDSRQHQQADGDGPANMADGKSDGGEGIPGSPVSISLSSEEGNAVPRNAEHQQPISGETRVLEAISGDAESSRYLARPSLGRAKEGEKPVAASARRTSRPIPPSTKSAAAPKVEGSPPTATAPTDSASGSKIETRSSARSARTPRPMTDSAVAPSSLSRLASYLSPAQTTLPRSGSSVQSTTLKRKRAARIKKRQSAVNRKLQKPEVEDTPCRTILVGDEHQASIPNLLPGGTGSIGVPSEGTGGGESAQLVWGSVRDWDHRSRDILDEYLQAAGAVIRKSQGLAGVPPHERLEEKKDGSDDAREKDSRGYDGFEARALTTGGDGNDPRAVDVARSERLRMHVPMSAIHRVQGKEEALEALRNTGCNLDNLEAALNELSLQTAKEMTPSWTLDQVKMLEDNLDKSVHRSNRGFRHMTRPGVKLDREDFIDLAAVSKSILGKTPAQVLDFYYRYLAAAQLPPVDHLHGAEATNPKKAESVPVVGSGGAVPPSMCADVPSARISVAHGERTQVGVVTASPRQAGIIASQHQATTGSSEAIFSSRELGEDSRRAPKSRRHVDDKGAAAGSFPIEPNVLEVNDSDHNHDGGSTTGGQDKFSSPPKPVVNVICRPATLERPVPPALHRRDDPTAQESTTKKHTLQPLEPGIPHKRSHVDDRARSGEGRRDSASVDYGGDDRGTGFWNRNHDLSGQPVGTDDVLGFMSSCWRLLDRESDQLDMNQLEYMRGLILAHIRLPMSREQLLTRAMSCLHSQPHVCASFVRTFDQLHEAPVVPLFDGRHPAPPATRVTIIPSSLAMPPCPYILPVVSWTTAPPVQSRAPPSQQLPCGGALPKREGPDFPRQPSLRIPRNAARGGLLAPTSASYGGNSLEMSIP